MLNKKIEKAFNDQLGAETYSAYLYWSMSAWFESANLSGFANWMRVQAMEEMSHAAKFFHFIAERGGRVKLGAIEAPPGEWDSPLAAFEAVYAHEQKVTGLINALVDLAQAEKDHAANAFLQWFVNEQVEEEASADQMVQKLKQVGEVAGAVFMLDQHMGERTFKAPAEE